MRFFIDIGLEWSFPCFNKPEIMILLACEGDAKPTQYACQLIDKWYRWFMGSGLGKAGVVLVSIRNNDIPWIPRQLVVPRHEC